MDTGVRGGGLRKRGGPIASGDLWGPVTEIGNEVRCDARAVFWVHAIL